MYSDLQLILVIFLVTVFLMAIILLIAYLIGNWQYNNHYLKKQRK